MPELNNSISGLMGQLKIPDSDTPLIRWCVLAIAAIALWFWIIEPLQLWTRDLSAQLSRNEAKASRLASLDKNKQAWIKAESSALQIVNSIEAGFFVAPSDTAAQAEIQKILQEYAVSRQLNLESQKLVAAENLDLIGNRLAVEMGVRGGLVNVLQYLDDISRTNKLFLIDRWIIQMDRNDMVYARFLVAGIRPISSQEQL